MNLFELIRTVRKNLAAANHFELQMEREKSKELRERWLAAAEREGQWMARATEAERDVTRLTYELGSARMAITKAYADCAEEARRIRRT